MKKVTLIGLLAVAALSMAAVGLAVRQDAPREAVAGAALGQDKDGQCEHQPGSPACQEAHAKGECKHGGECDPANCDPEKCGGQCGRHHDGCNPADCDPAKCGDRCGRHADPKGRAGCAGHTRGGCAGHSAGGGE